MKIHPFFALSSCIVIAACAVPGQVPAGPTASMPQVTCSVRELAPSQHANRAQAALNRTVLEGQDNAALYREALEHARAGLAEDAENPYHHLLAGWATAGSGQLVEAAEYFDQALAYCPELEEEYVEPARMQGWINVFGSGLDAYRAGNAETAVDHWERAAAFWDGLGNAHFNLAIVHGERGNYERATEHYMEALRIIEASPLYRGEDETAAEGRELRASSINGLIVMGVQFFQQERFDRAAEIFREALRVEPYNRDASYNLGLALMRMERWAELEEPARRAVEADPLNFQARVVLFNSFRGRAEAAAAARQTEAEQRYRNQALQVLQEAEQISVRISDIRVVTEEGTARVVGQATGTQHRGGPVTLAFTLYGASGEIGSGTTTIERPAQDQAAAFSLQIPVSEPVTGWRYSVR